MCALKAQIQGSHPLSKTTTTPATKKKLEVPQPAVQQEQEVQPQRGGDRLGQGRAVRGTVVGVVHHCGERDRDSERWS